MYYLIPARLSVKFPYKPPAPVEDAGVLTGCMERLVSRKRMDEIICQMVKRHPYIEGAVYINVPIIWQDEEGNSGLYHEIESTFSAVGHKRGEEVGNLDTRIYKPYVCIHCKHRKNIVLKEMTRVGVTWREALEENSVLAKSHADKIRPKPEVEEEIADFQLIDREYLKIAQSLFPDRDILKEDPSA